MDCDFPGEGLFHDFSPLFCGLMCQRAPWRMRCVLDWRLCDYVDVYTRGREESEFEEGCLVRGFVLDLVPELRCEL